MKHWKRSWTKTGNRTNIRAWLFLYLALSSFVGLSGCAKREYVAVNLRPCPEMSVEAIASWSDVHQMTSEEFRVWMGQTIVYCEQIESQLED